MKKMYYSVCDNGTVEAARYDGREMFLITISDEDARKHAFGSVVAETGGHSISYEVDPEEMEEITNIISENWDALEQMTEEEANERIMQLAVEFGISDESTMSFLK